MADDEFDPLLQSILQEWNAAEKMIKIAEQIDGEIVNPAIYELRYAGRRLVEALPCREQDETKAKALLVDAKFNCHRAQHDAIDAATSKMVGDLTVAADKLGAQVLLSHFAEFPKLYRRLFEVREKVAASRENRNDRDRIYETISSVDLEEILPVFYDFRASEPLMIQSAMRDRRRKIFDRTLAIGGIALAIVGILFGFMR